jgi:type I restriction enzyme, S subunit
MAHVLFRTWFAALDPPGARVAELVQGHVLEIGDGYRAKNSELGESGLPFIRAGDLNNGFDTAGADLLREESVAKAGSKVSRVGDVAFTSKGTIGRFARVTEHTARFVYSPQICYWRSLDPSRLHPVILYCWMQSDHLREQIAAVADQTDMAPYVSLQDQRAMIMPVFPSSQQTIARRIESLLARQALNAAEAKTLSALRDGLLPKLISGELRVKGASSLAEHRLIADDRGRGTV